MYLFVGSLDGVRFPFPTLHQVPRRIDATGVANRHCAGFGRVSIFNEILPKGVSMARSDMTPHSAFATPELVDERVSTFLRAVYAWMCAGLAITAVTAWFIASSPALVTTIATNRLLFWGLILARLGIVQLVSKANLSASTVQTPTAGFRSVSGVIFEITGAGKQPVAGAFVDFEPIGDFPAAITFRDA